MIYEDALDLDDVSLSILPTENQTSGSAIRYQLQSPRSYQFVYLLSIEYPLLLLLLFCCHFREYDIVFNNEFDK